MNIGQLAKACHVTTDTLRHYEKQGLLSSPARQQNGYRSYTLEHVAQVRFIRGAQSLGFSLTEIRAILPQMAAGSFGRAEIEQQLRTKMTQIDAHIQQLTTLKAELAAAFASLTCTPDRAISTSEGTAPDAGSGAGAAVVKKTFVNGKKG